VELHRARDQHRFIRRHITALFIVIVAPLIVIFIGAARSPKTEYIGWALLLILLALRFAG
jgi:hypothetical protein